MSGNNATAPLSPEGALYINIALKGRYTLAPKGHDTLSTGAAPRCPSPEYPALSGLPGGPGVRASKTNGAAPLAGVLCPFRAKNVPHKRIASLTEPYLPDPAPKGRDTSDPKGRYTST